MKFSTVEEAIHWLDSQTSTTTRVGIEKIRLAMEYFNNPHHGLPVIHLTGTNGKGSTTSYLKQLLLSQGIAVGTFTSPHIMRFNERISYNGTDISDENLIDLVEQMVPMNEYMAKTPYGRLVFFELYTVMMALYFQDKQPDVCLIEVGIGGENDCTNIFDGQMAILTTIALDHEDKLGNTVEQVALEKSGIIKDKAIVITGPIASSPLNIIQDKVSLVGGKHYRFNEEYGFERKMILSENGTSFTYWDNNLKDTLDLNWQLTMLGAHQVDNASIALKAFFEWMRINEKSIDLHAAKQALCQTKWLARMEKMNEEPLVYIDGAHNTQGLKALCRLVKEYFPEKEITILYAGLTTKNQGEQLPLLLAFEPAELYLTEFEHYQSMTSKDIDEVVEENDGISQAEFEFVSNWREFVYNYLLQDNQEKMLLITGSLYFASDVRQLFSNKVKL